MKTCFALIIIILTLSFQSCSFIHFIGTKNILPKTPEEVEDYLKANKIDYYDYSFVTTVNLDTLSSKKHILNLWKYERDREESLIQLRVYNSTGNLINGYTQCYGEMYRGNILSEKETKFFRCFPNNYSLIFSDELSMLNISDEQKKELLQKNSEKDKTFVIYWNIWSNAYSKIIFKKLKKYLRKYDMRDQSLIILINDDNIIRRKKKPDINENL